MYRNDYIIANNNNKYKYKNVEGAKLTEGRASHRSGRPSTPPQIKHPLSFTTTQSYLVTKFRIYGTFSIKFTVRRTTTVHELLKLWI